MNWTNTGDHAPRRQPWSMYLCLLGRHDPGVRAMRWMKSWRADPVAKPLADRHYNRQNPASAQFVPPATCLVLRTPDAAALWVTTWPLSKYVKHAWPGAWVCSLFRNERPDLYLSSELIREAVAATRFRYGEAPAELGMVTFVDPGKTRRKRDPGRCFVRAGFTRLDVRTKEDGLVVLQMLPAAMPDPAEPLGQLRLELSLRVTPPGPSCAKCGQSDPGLRRYGSGLFCRSCREAALVLVEA